MYSQPLAVLEVLNLINSTFCGLHIILQQTLG